MLTYEDSLKDLHFYNTEFNLDLSLEFLFLKFIRRYIICDLLLYKVKTVVKHYLKQREDRGH